jgi:Nitrile hydratase beta subunit
VSEHQFRVGDPVRVKSAGGNPRTPAYVRGQIGQVVKLHGQMDNPLDHRDVYPPLCTVAFSAGVRARDRLYVDLHEDWLEPA